MSTEQAFISRLGQDADVHLATKGGQIFYGHAPPDTRPPYVVLLRAFTRRENHQAGVSKTAFVQMIVECYAATLSEAADLGDKLRLSSDGLRNATIGLPPNAVEAASLVLMAEFADPVETKSGAGHTLYRWSQEWHCWADEKQASPI